MKKTEQLYKLFLQYPNISTDTRKELNNSIFFALSGENFNGNKFALEALNKGAVIAVVDDRSYLVAGDNRYFFVEDCLIALQDLALFHRRHFSIPVIAITGTNGKTTTKEAIARVLASEKKIVATEGNFNNHIGVPINLLHINRETEVAVIEMGANHPGEIGSLCKIVEPTHGLITNIGKAHLEGFGSMQGVIETKKELYNFVKKNGGTLFVNKEDQLLMSLSKGIHRFTYGKTDADFNVQLLSAQPSLQLQWQENNKKYTVESQLYGSYNFYNLAAAIAIGRFFGILVGHVVHALSGWETRNNRSQQLETGHNHIILDAYNANPDSMLLAITDFAEHAFAKPVLILGDMFELGEAAAKEHEFILTLLDKYKFQDVMLVGKEFVKTTVGGSRKTFVSTDEAAKYLQKYPIRNSQILIKGSRGMQLEQLVQYL